MALSIEIVSPSGIEYSATCVERVVVRRREAQHDPGSEIAICSHHAPLLMQVQACRMRVTQAGETSERDVPAGVLEVCGDRITFAIT